MCKIEKLSDTKEFYYLRQNPYDHQSIRLSTSDVDIRVFCVVKYQVKLKKKLKRWIELRITLSSGIKRSEIHTSSGVNSPSNECSDPSMLLYLPAWKWNPSSLKELPVWPNWFTLERMMFASDILKLVLKPANINGTLLFYRFLVQKTFYKTIWRCHTDIVFKLLMINKIEL